MRLRIVWLLLPLILALGFVVLQSNGSQANPAVVAVAQATAEPTHDMDAMATMDAVTAEPMAGMEMGGMEMGGGATMAALPGMEYMGYMGDENDQALMLSHMQPVPSANVIPAPNQTGSQPLEFTFDGETKVFELVARPYLWNILPNVTAVAWAYNGQVPGPTIRVTEGDRVRVNFRNELPEPTTVHWHGLHVPNNMDGVPFISQPPIESGGSFTYEFTVTNPAGSYWFHSHYHDDLQIGLGLHGMFIVDPLMADPANTPDVDVSLMFNEWRILGGMTFPSMPMTDMDPNYFTINGKSYPAVPPVVVQRGQRVRLRLVAVGQFIHPIHLHGQHFEVTAIDGMPVPLANRQLMDTYVLAPGQHVDIEFTANEVGPWMLHCHIPHHQTNNFRLGHGGLTMVINVIE